MASERQPSLRTSEYRKVVKPLLERRRRARINCCLGELKGFIVNAMKHDHVQASKLEKADILEQTVQYLRAVRRLQMTTGHHQHREPSNEDNSRFRAGFAECAHEVSIFVSGSPSVHPNVTSRLLSHLSTCVQRSQEGTCDVTDKTTPTQMKFQASSCRSQVSMDGFHQDQRLWRPW